MKSNDDRKGLTLIELLIAISITTIIVGVVVTTLKAGFDTYSFSQEQALLEKALDQALDNVTGSGFENYGIKDAVEVLNISPGSITFVPMWVEDVDITASGPLILDPPLKPGAALPIAEIVKNKTRRALPVAFIPGDPLSQIDRSDKIIFSEPVNAGDKVRLVYYPEAASFPKAAMTIKWEGGKLTRSYNGRNSSLLRYDLPGVTLSSVSFRYFDSTNNEVPPNSTEAANVTAVEVSITASIKSGASKTGFTFVNLRNTRTAGAGLILKRGMRIKLPDSRKVRMFSITNITGAKPGGTIELAAIPAKGDTWKVIVNLDCRDGVSSIKGYTIEYPAGNAVHSESLNASGDVPLNFMNLGPSGYGSASRAKYSPDDPNTINISGDVELVVERMDARGAMLFIRP